jgi:hypothetical protein
LGETGHEAPICGFVADTLPVAVMTHRHHRM